MEMIGYILLPAFVAGIIQGVTGFGAGVVMMMFLPLVLYKVREFQVLFV